MQRFYCDTEACRVRTFWANQRERGDKSIEPCPGCSKPATDFPVQKGVA